MSEIIKDELVPHVAKVISVRTDTNDVKTFGVVGIDDSIMFDLVNVLWFLYLVWVRQCFQSHLHQQIQSLRNFLLKDVVF